MTRDIPQSTIRSIRDRLKNEADKRGVTYEFMAVRYGLERFLHRLTESGYRDHFVLKGATLFLPWEGDFHRPTRDLDFSGREYAEVGELESVVREICKIEPEQEDGLLFNTESVQGAKIREGRAYEGIRIKFDAELGSHELRLQLDIGFGDALEPQPEMINYPSLLDFDPVELTAYRRENVISEKFQFIVVMGMGNSRMKDYYDIWYMSENFKIEGKKLQPAIRKTFERRETKLPEDLPIGLSDDFTNDERSRRNWNGLMNKLNLESKLTLAETVTRIRTFLMPVVNHIEEDEEFRQNWTSRNMWE